MRQKDRFMCCYAWHRDAKHVRRLGSTFWKFLILYTHTVWYEQMAEKTDSRDIASVSFKTWTQAVCGRFSGTGGEALSISGWTARDPLIVPHENVWCCR
jgi:hypothetical protein